MSSLAIAIQGVGAGVIFGCFIALWVYHRLETKRCMERMITELFTRNRVDRCWDPIGSIDTRAVEILIEVITKDKLPRDRKILSRREFDEVRLKEMWCAKDF